MKSAITTLENAIKGLKIELKIWGQKPNYSSRITSLIKQEIQEHEMALRKLRTNN